MLSFSKYSIMDLGKVESVVISLCAAKHYIDINNIKKSNLITKNFGVQVAKKRFPRLSVSHKNSIKGEQYGSIVHPNMIASDSVRYGIDDNLNKHLYNGYMYILF